VQRDCQRRTAGARSATTMRRNCSRVVRLSSTCAPERSLYSNGGRVSHLNTADAARKPSPRGYMLRAAPCQRGALFCRGACLYSTAGSLRQHVRCGASQVAGATFTAKVGASVRRSCSRPRSQAEGVQPGDQAGVEVVVSADDSQVAAVHRAVGGPSWARDETVPWI